MKLVDIYRDDVNYHHHNHYHFIFFYIFFIIYLRFGIQNNFLQLNIYIHIHMYFIDNLVIIISTLSLHTKSYLNMISVEKSENYIKARLLILSSPEDQKQRTALSKRWHMNLYGIIFQSVVLMKRSLWPTWIDAKRTESKRWDSRKAQRKRRHRKNVQSE